MKPYQRRDRVWNSTTPTSTEKLVLLALESFCDSDGYCFPGQNKIARMTGFDKTTVRRSLQSLAKKGIVAIANRHGQDGRQTSNSYTVRFSQLSLAVEPQQKPRATESMYAQAEAPAPRVTDAPRPMHAAPLPSDRLPPKLSQVTSPEKPTHIRPDVCGIDLGFQSAARALGVDIDNRQLATAAKQHPDRLDSALNCLKEKGDRISHPTQFLAKAIQRNWKPKGLAKNNAPSGFGEWFSEAKKRGIAIASELRDGAIFIYTSSGCSPFDVLKLKSWDELAAQK